MLNRNDESNEIKNMVLFCIAAASIVLLLFLVVLYMKDSNASNHVTEEPVVEEAVEEEDVEYGKSNLVSSDLDFWEMYDSPSHKVKYDDPDEDEQSNQSINDNDDKKNKDKNAEVESEEKTESKSSDEKKKVPNKKDNTRDDKKDEASSDNSMNKDKELDDSDEENALKVIGKDGKPAFFDVLDDVPKNTYNFEDYLQIENSKLTYSDGKSYAVKGIDITKHQGTVDFAKVRSSGIDFVMLRVAARGYETGSITIDDKFVDYATAAISAGLPIGVYFNSQAITDVEAVEEANYAIAASMNYNLSYPVACYLEDIDSENLRTKKLTNKDRTFIVNKFCETVVSYGRMPIICATRDFLISKLDLDDLKQWDVWIREDIDVSEKFVSTINNTNSNETNVSSSSSSSNTMLAPSTSSSSEYETSNTDVFSGDVLNGPDYPYRYSMWQYSDSGRVDGVNGNVNMDIYFVDYVER